MTARGCGCPATPHQHGCRNRYDRGCRCDTCRAGIRAIRRNYRNPNRPTNTSRTPEHLEYLDYIGQEIAWFETWHMTDERIASLVGLTVDAIQARRRR